MAPCSYHVFIWVRLGNPNVRSSSAGYTDADDFSILRILDVDVFNGYIVAVFLQPFFNGGTHKSFAGSVGAKWYDARL